MEKKDQPNPLPNPETPHTDAARRPQTQKPSAVDLLAALREQIDKARDQALIDTSAWAKASEALDAVKGILLFLA